MPAFETSLHSMFLSENNIKMMIRQYPVQTKHRKVMRQLDLRSMTRQRRSVLCNAQQELVFGCLRHHRSKRVSNELKYRPIGVLISHQGQLATGPSGSTAAGPLQTLRWRAPLESGCHTKDGTIILILPSPVCLPRDRTQLLSTIWEPFCSLPRIRWQESE